jgi:hypothetical protein
VIVVSGKSRIWIGAQASVLDNSDDRLMAWAEQFVRKDKDIKWILGNFVEADNANHNGHIFPLDDLRASIASIPVKPLNMLHHGNYIVGAFAGAEFCEPQSEQAREGPVNTYIEALSAFWHRFFPEEYQLVEKAHKEGALFYSMECDCDTLTCAADDGCGQTYPFRGRTNDAYCAHLQKPGSKKKINKPWFNAGALIVPPVKPGWSRADISELAQWMKTHDDEAEALYAGFEEEAPHLDAATWEGLMGEVVLTAKDFSQGERKKLAKEGKAKSDGSFPIENASDLKNAIQAVGRAKDPAAARAHVIRRARALGLTKLLPDGWKASV